MEQAGTVVRVRRFRFWVLLAWTLFFCVLLYGALLLLSRTDGFRSLLAEQLEQRYGLRVSMASSRLDWQLNLHLEGMQLTDQGGEADHPQLFVGKVMLSWEFPGWSLSPVSAVLVLDDCQIKMVQDKTGAWQPAVVRPLAERIGRIGRMGSMNLITSTEEPVAASVAEEPEPESKSDLQSSRFAVRDLRITNSQLSWWRDGKELVAVKGITFVRHAVLVGGRELVYYKLDADEAQLGPARKMDDLSFEVLSTEGRTIILGPTANWGNGHLNVAGGSVEKAKPQVKDRLAATAMELEMLQLAEDRMAVRQETVVVVEEKPPLNEQDLFMELNQETLDDLSEDESAALVEYIRDMLEMDEPQGN